MHGRASQISLEEICKQRLRLMVEDITKIPRFFHEFGNFNEIPQLFLDWKVKTHLLGYPYFQDCVGALKC